MNRKFVLGSRSYCYHAVITQKYRMLNIKIWMYDSGRVTLWRDCKNVEICGNRGLSVIDRNVDIKLASPGFAFCTGTHVLSCQKHCAWRIPPSENGCDCFMAVWLSLKAKNGKWKCNVLCGYAQYVSIYVFVMFACRVQWSSAAKAELLTCVFWAPALSRPPASWEIILIYF